MCVLSINVPIRKKSGNLFNDPRIYIYIYILSSTDCFDLSELFSVAIHAGRSKPGSKPVQLYVRLNRPPSGPRRLREFLRHLLSSSSSRLFTFFIPYRLPECSMADLGPLIRHLVSTRLPSGGRAAVLSPLSPLYGTRPCV